MNKKRKKRLSKSEFITMLSEEMIENAKRKEEMVAGEKEVDNEEQRKSSRGVEHMFCTMALPLGSGMGQCFNPPAMHTRSTRALSSVRGWSGYTANMIKHFFV